MFGVPVLATIAFAIAGTFSPGPNNVMSASLGISKGFRRTTPFLAGIACGFVIVMLCCAAASATLLGAIPRLEPVLRWIGTAYILWLAWTSWAKRDSLGAKVDEASPASSGFIGGFLLQFVNVKIFVYGLMMYSTFLAGLTGHAVALAVSAVALALVGVASTTTWAAGGMAIRHWLKTPRDRAIVAGVLALTLVYTAIELLDPGRLVGR